MPFRLNRSRKIGALLAIVGLVALVAGRAGLITFSSSASPSATTLATGQLAPPSDPVGSYRWPDYTIVSSDTDLTQVAAYDSLSAANGVPPGSVYATGYNPTTGDNFVVYAPGGANPVTIPDGSGNSTQQVVVVSSGTYAGWAYVLNDNANTVTILDGSNVEATLSLPNPTGGAGVQSAAVVDSTGDVWVAEQSYFVELSGTSIASKEQVSGTGTPSEVIVDQATGAAYGWEPWFDSTNSTTYYPFWPLSESVADQPPPLTCSLGTTPLYFIDSGSYAGDLLTQGPDENTGEELASPVDPIYSVSSSSCTKTNIDLGLVGTFDSVVNHLSYPAPASEAAVITEAVPSTGYTSRFYVFNGDAPVGSPMARWVAPAPIRYGPGTVAATWRAGIIYAITQDGLVDIWPAAPLLNGLGSSTVDVTGYQGSLSTETTYGDSAEIVDPNIPYAVDHADHNVYFCGVSPPLNSSGAVQWFVEDYAPSSASQTVIDLPDGGGCFGVVYNPSDGDIYVDQGNLLSIISTSSNSVVASVGLSNPGGEMYTQFGDTVGSENYLGVPQGMSQIRYDPTSHEVVVVDGSDLEFLSGTSVVATPTIVSGQSVVSIAESPNGTLYATTVAEVTPSGSASYYNGSIAEVSAAGSVGTALDLGEIESDTETFPMLSASSSDVYLMNTTLGTLRGLPTDLSSTGVAMSISGTSSSTAIEAAAIDPVTGDLYVSFPYNFMVFSGTTQVGDTPPGTDTSANTITFTPSGTAILSQDPQYLSGTYSYQKPSVTFVRQSAEVADFYFVGDVSWAVPADGGNYLVVLGEQSPSGQEVIDTVSAFYPSVISWQAAPGPVQGYEVFSSSTASGPWTPFGTTSGTTFGVNGSPYYKIESTDGNWRSAPVEVGVG